MLGVIGIVFSLSIFSIQQVAERGTALTVREYTKDWVFRLVYWALALFAIVAVVSAVRKSDSALIRVCVYHKTRQGPLWSASTLLSKKKTH
jgi:hypothetical protein